MKVIREGFIAVIAMLAIVASVAFATTITGNGTTFTPTAPNTISNRNTVQLQKVFSQYTNSEGTPGFTLVALSNGPVHYYKFTNTAAYPCYVHFYDTSSNPTPGTTPSKWTIAIPATSSVEYNPYVPGDIRFFNGVAYSVTKGSADTDATHALVGDVVGFFTYK